MSLLDQVKKTAYEGYKAVVTTVQQPPTVSAFKEKGFLTPQEFVEAGDLLVSACHSWKWEGGDDSLALPYLPKDKQFLVTRNVSCRKRAVAMQTLMEEHMVENEDGEDGWTETFEAGKGEGDKEAGSSDMPCIGSMSISDAAPAQQEDDDDDSIPDMDDVDSDDDALEAPVRSMSSDGADDAVLLTRTYDVSITYDTYHWTPRMWLFGYNERRSPLSPKDLLDDISEEHARKTVTIDAHPHVKGVPHVSIHPCRHAEVMKQLVNRMEDSGRPMRPDQSLFLFLKFIASAVPTIEYDFTQPVGM